MRRNGCSWRLHPLVGCATLHWRGLVCWHSPRGFLRQTSCTPVRSGPVAQPIHARLRETAAQHWNLHSFGRKIRQERGCHLWQSMIINTVVRRPENASQRDCRKGCEPHCPKAIPSKTLEILYRSEHGRLLAFLSCKVGNEQAKDLAQEVFLRAAASDQIDQLRNPTAFLFQIARNILIDRSRRQSCRLDPLPLFDGHDVAEARGHEEYLQARDLEAYLERSLARLPEKTVRIFSMSRIERKSYREIHEELGIALATVDYHMMKALSHLRAQMNAIA